MASQIVRACLDRRSAPSLFHPVLGGMFRAAAGAPSPLVQGRREVGRTPPTRYHALWPTAQAAPDAWPTHARGRHAETLMWACPGSAPCSSPSDDYAPPGGGARANGPPRSRGARPCIQHPTAGRPGEQGVYGHVGHLAWAGQHPVWPPWPGRCAPRSTPAKGDVPVWPRNTHGHSAPRLETAAEWSAG